jgi:hypothetical protein
MKEMCLWAIWVWVTRTAKANDPIPHLRASSWLNHRPCVPLLQNQLYCLYCMNSSPLIPGKLSPFTRILLLNLPFSFYLWSPQHTDYPEAVNQYSSLQKLTAQPTIAVVKRWKGEQRGKSDSRKVYNCETAYWQKLDRFLASLTSTPFIRGCGWWHFWGYTLHTYVSSVTKKSLY